MVVRGVERKHFTISTHPLTAPWSWRPGLAQLLTPGPAPPLSFNQLASSSAAGRRPAAQRRPFQCQCVQRPTAIAIHDQPW